MRFTLFSPLPFVINGPVKQWAQSDGEISHLVLTWCLEARAEATPVGVRYPTAPIVLDHL
jgi:hypothetical protein